jgi:hypothetical protein
MAPCSCRANSCRYFVVVAPSPMAVNYGVGLYRNNKTVRAENMDNDEAMVLLAAAPPKHGPCRGPE